MHESIQKTRRFWFQFRLRSALIAMALLSLPLAWFSTELAAARRQAAAVEQISQWGGRAIYEYQVDEVRPIVGTTMAQTFVRIRAPHGPQWMNEWFGIDLCNSIDRVVLDRTPVPQQQAIELVVENIPSVRKLMLIGKPVEDLSPLVRLEHLDELALFESAASHEQVEMLRIMLPNCQIHQRGWFQLEE